MRIEEQIAYEQAFEVLLVEIALADERYASQMFSALCRIQNGKSEKIGAVVFDRDGYHKFAMVTTSEDKLLQVETSEKLSEMRTCKADRVVWVSKTASISDLVSAARLIIKIKSV